jgi:TrmH family RNA methyltransferase
MGAHFRLPVHELPWNEIRLYCQDHQLAVFLATAGSRQTYTSVNLRAPCALLIGSEAQGAGKDAIQLAHQEISIPMQPGVDSLNAAIAAAILMFEVVRQRKNN